MRREFRKQVQCLGRGAAALALLFTPAPIALGQETAAPGAGETPPRSGIATGGAIAPGTLSLMDQLMAAEPQVAATDRYVYVLRGGQLSAFDSRTMRLTGSIPIRPSMAAALPAENNVPAPGPLASERTGDGREGAAGMPGAEAAGPTGATVEAPGAAPLDPHAAARLLATDRAVYVLVGNELMAFEPGALRSRGAAIVPARPLRPGTLDAPEGRGDPPGEADPFARGSARQ